MFEFCGSLTSIMIPSSVTNIGSAAFIGCTNLTNITVDPFNPNYASIDGVLFNKSLTSILECPGGRAGSYAILNGVTNIGNYAFYECGSLTSVYIPASVRSLGFDAFYNCALLSKIFCSGNTPSLYNDVDNIEFGYNKNLAIYYLPGALGWSNTLGGWPAILWNPQAQTGDAFFGVRTNRFGFNITGSSNLVLVVEASTNLVNPVWQALGTYTLSNAPVYFSDAQWTNYPGRYYRFRSP